MTLATPTTLASTAERHRRTMMLAMPHMEPLMRHLRDLRAGHSGRQMPCFDPCDGGINARALFLLQAPSQVALTTGFISRENPDPTAKNISALMQEADIARGDTLLWNIVPWTVADPPKVSEADLREGLSAFKDLLKLLPDLEVIVLLGKRVQSVQAQIRSLTNAPCIETPMPTGQVFNAWPEKRAESKLKFRQIAEIIQR